MTHSTTDRIVQTGGVRHLTSDEAYAQVATRYGVREITDACAATIASWWQSPGIVGHVLATLASGLPVNMTELLDDIAATRYHCVDDAQHSQLDVVALDMLATWAINGGER